MGWIPETLGYTTLTNVTSKISKFSCPEEGSLFKIMNLVGKKAKLRAQVSQFFSLEFLLQYLTSSRD